MMYATGQEFIKDFAQRTIENYNHISDDSYKVTQLINSSIGLLVIPQQKLFNKISDKMISSQLLQEMRKTITTPQCSIPTKLSTIARHMRNSITHATIKFNAENASTNNNSLTIYSVTFTDEDPESHNIFELTVPIPLLEKFFLEFSAAATKLK